MTAEYWRGKMDLGARSLDDRCHWPEVAALRLVGKGFHGRGWSLGTSSNYSLVLGRNPLTLLVTASGKHKGELSEKDFVLVGAQGSALVDGDPKPSAETMLHVVLARAGAAAILHTHSVWGTLLSDLFHEQGGFAIEGYEMLKGLEGVTSHEERKWVEIFDNTQDIPQLAAAVQARLNDSHDPLLHGFLIRGHGLYAWGRDLAEAQRHIEIFEFLFEVFGRRLTLRGVATEPLSGV